MWLDHAPLCLRPPRMIWIPPCLSVRWNNLLWLSVTVGAYLLGRATQRALRGHPAANPVLIAITVVSAILALTHTPYDSDFRSTRLLTFLLAPATVALGVPLEHNPVHVRRSL